ncbi:MAG: biosynthetic-type acetolactate synthase large subunit [Clostridiales bacterium]|nr:biosynthetic-type acetolactate synthase large subunit [Clostridiales bacterium]
MKLTGAQIVIETLLEQGVDTVFGFPGATVIDIYDKLFSCKDKITHVLTAHEQGAAHAADGYARSTGKPGVVIATSGPGATNLVTGIATAFLDSVPVIAITGNVSNSMIGRDAFQEIDITGVTLPITKHNFFVRDIKVLADTIREAFKIAVSGRPGPVLIDIPNDIQIGTCEFKPLKKVIPAKPPKADDAMIAKAAELIAECKRPYIYFGGGAVRAGAGSEILTLAEKIDAFIGCSMMGLSEIPSNHPRFLGMQGMHGHFASSVALAKSDLMIAVGVRFSDRATGKTDRYALNSKKIHIDADIAEIGKNVSVDLGVCCNVKDFLARLADAVEEKKLPEWEEKIKSLRARESDAYDDDTFVPREVILEIADKVKPDTRIVTDVGQHQMWTAQFYNFRKKHTWLSSGGLGTMGFGLGAAIGSTFATGKRAVLISGDGSFGMSLNELATAVTYKVPVTVVIFNNRTLGMVRQWHTLFYDKRYAGTTLERDTDFVKLAEAFGAKGFRADNIDEFRSVFAKAYAYDGPSVIDMRIDQDAMVLPMLRPGGTFDNLVTWKEAENEEG